MRHTTRWLRFAVVLPLTAFSLILAACSDAVDPIAAPDTQRGPQLAIGVDPVSGASIETNLDDYVPGEIVHLVLKGWAPGEDVRLIMTEDPDTHEDVDTTVTVDGQGEWNGHFYDVQEHDLGVTFTLTGTGQTSGRVATVVFTDGNPGNPTVAGLQSPNPLTAGGAATYTIRVAYTGNSSACIVNLSATPTSSPAWPASGYTFSFSPTSLSGGGGDGPTSVLTVSTPASMSPGTYKFTVLAAVTAGCQGVDQTSAAIDLVVGAAASAATTTTVSGTPTPSVTGQSVIFTATVEAGVTPVTTGTVDFRFGGTDCSTGTIFASVAALNGSGQATATRAFTASETGSTIRACYSGATGFTASNGSTTHAVNKGTVLVTLGDSPDPSVTGQSVTLSATVTAVLPSVGTPTGTVTFYASGTCSTPGSELGTDPADPWSISTTLLAAANSPYTLLACYSGDTEFEAGSDTEEHTVDLIATTTTVAGSPNPSVSGQSVTFTATVLAGASPVTTGTVDFRFGGTDCTDGTVFGSAAVLNGLGEATANRAFNATETGATIRACYSGSPTQAASAGTTMQTVNKADVLVTLSDDVDPSVFGQSVALSATVTAEAPGTGTPTGTVTFYDGGTCASPGTSLGSDASAPWTVSTSALAVGGHTLLACYAGDSNFNEGGDTESHTVNKAATTTTVGTSGTPSTYGISVTFTATVAVSLPGAGNPTGTLTFYEFSAGQSCSVPGAATALATTTLPANSFSTASLTVAGSPHRITACYGGDGNFLVSNGYVDQAVNAAAVTSTASVSPTTQQYSDKVTISTVLALSSGALNGQTLTGSVEFFIGARSVGTEMVSTTTLSKTVTLTPDTPLTDETPSATPYDIKAVFTSTNANFAPGTRTDASLTVTKEDATVYDTDEPDAVQVASAGGTSPAITISGRVRETNPELNLDQTRVAAGDITKVTSVVVRLEGISAGGDIGTCTAGSLGTGGTTGYGAWRTFSCTIPAGLEVDTYEVIVTVGSNHYVGEYHSVLTVFDPSLGFITGGGRFTLDGDRTNFGFVGRATVLNRKTVIKGSLLVIRHLPDGSIVRMKSNVFNGLAVKNDGSATFSGKANNSVNSNNYDFTAYVKDVATPGSGADRFGLFYPLPNLRTSSTLNGASGLVATSVLLTGGNIQVPQPQPK